MLTKCFIYSKSLLFKYHQVISRVEKSEKDTKIWHFLEKLWTSVKDSVPSDSSDLAENNGTWSVATLEMVEFSYKH